MQEIGTITDPSASVYYFEMIHNQGYRRILDAGMFLKRIGAAARQALGYEISEEIQLCGIDFFPEFTFPVYQNIYNEIIMKNSFMDQEQADDYFGNTKFDAAVLLKADSILNEEEKTKLLKYFIQSAEAVLTDIEIGEWAVCRGFFRGYYPVAVQDSRYAWIPVSELRLQHTVK